MNTRIQFIASILSSVIPLAWWLLALWSPSYHYQQIIFPINGYAFVDVSLWTMHAQSDCLPMLYNAPFLKRWERTTPSIDERACRWILRNIDGHTLSDVTTFVCSGEYMMLNTLNYGCTTIANLSNASKFVIGCIALSIMSDICTICATALFFTCRPITKVRLLVLLTAFAPVAFGAFAVFLYTYVGGYLTSKSFGALQMVDTAQKSEMVSYNFGFVVFNMTILLQFLGCIGQSIFVKLNLCVDCPKNQELEERAEMKKLMRKVVDDVDARFDHMDHRAGLLIDNRNAHMYV